jgi:hypothetical protein
MENIEPKYKTSAKQREASKKYRQANKDKLNTYHRESHKEKMNDPIYQQKRKDFLSLNFRLFPSICILQEIIR